MPTVMQREAFKEITEKHRPVSRAMIDVGYSEHTASKPSNLTKSKGWIALMDKHIPDSLLAKKHLALLNKEDKITGDIDVQAVSKGLDMAYKIKNKYPKDTNIFAFQFNSSDRHEYAKSKDISQN